MAKHEKKVRSDRIVILISEEEKRELENAFLEYALRNDLGHISVSTMCLRLIREWKKTNFGEQKDEEQLDLFHRSLKK